MSTTSVQRLANAFFLPLQRATAILRWLL